MCTAHHLAQHIADSTRGNNTLDFVISDFEGPVATAIHPSIGHSDHAVVTACFSSAAPHINHSTTRKAWRYTSANWGLLRHFFGTTNCSAVINDNPNHSCLKTTQHIIQGMEKFIPSKILTTLPSDHRLPYGGHQSACK